MDPLSISFGIVGVLPLIAKAITTARSYIQSVAGAEKMITALILELEVLQGAIRKLDALLRSEALGDDDLKFDQTSVLLSCSAAIEAKLQELVGKLTHESSGRKLGARRLLWPLSEKEHQKTLAELRSLSGWVQFALSVDGCRLLARTSEKVVEVLAGQLEQFQAMRRLDTATTEMLGAVRKQAAVAEREGRGRILDWLSTARYDARHAILRRERAKNTGSWLLESARFTQWRDGLAASRVLWCNGIQGSGKTILACAAIDELRSHGSLAYFYFDYQDHDSQPPLAVVSCILRQLLEQLPDLPASVKELYEARNKLEGRQLPEYERLLDEVVRGSEVTYLVLDALDECEHGRYMLQLIDRLNQIENCRILVTSRPHVYKQLPVSRSYSEIKIEAREEDIKRYVLEQCDVADIHQIADEHFVDQLVDKLTRSASGMFLLPVLQLRTVLNEPTIGEMEDKLEQLTDVLSDAFEETLSRIQRLPGSRSRLTLSALMHLAHAKRLLQAAELSDVLALRPDSTSVNAKYRPTAKIILECCQGLVTLDEQTGQLRLAHYSIQEYLVATSETLFPQFEVKLALNCLGYMLLDDFKAGPFDTREEIDARLKAYPFLSYVSEFWGSYVQPVETDLEVWDKLLAFYMSLSAASAATQVLFYQKGYHEGYYGVQESVSTTPLHHAAVNCLVHSTRGLLEHFAVDEATAMGTTPIIKAAAGGHVAVVALLLEHGADPRLQNWYGDALQCAAEAGECATIRQLVEWGMSPDGEPGCDRSPLSCALDRDSAHAVEVLAGLGADLRLDNEDEHENVFLEACHRNGEKTVELMLRRGWVDLRSRPHHTVLAMRAATLPMLRRLIEAGADVNAVDKHGRTALWYMRQEFNDKAIDSLQGAGATLDGNTRLMNVGVSTRELKVDELGENGLGVESIETQRATTLVPGPNGQFQCDVPGCALKFDESVELQYHQYYKHDSHGRLLTGLVTSTSSSKGSFEAHARDLAGDANHSPLPIRSQDKKLDSAG
ncbi:ankyrin repeat-containing domain protein [Cordyceps fumosorosea ARSEF 2679]|uniref:Ankyrin repeat-containing domain protein n=1 Tax=Cordyceps fumosorosea (strain ARSEF 2679) TaxID=1081104 RepID=A0A162J4Y2_CORFA|nr:ankyrin repeat-containing domain protein [Cordyceps fumosorosea ARSEF 2679]OAA63782.1 ankyrin repeat-containing domain protein [Cordyceps fumosorosea ARSEF 2679]